jgi:hypothetical protein
MAHLFALLDLLSRFRWYRRLIGGHWELWWIGLEGFAIWFETGECYFKTRLRPAPLCSGLPRCEEHGEWMPVEPW